MEIINNFLWSIATILLVLSGIYFAFKLKFLHLNFKKMLKSLKSDNNKLGISPFESLSVSLGGCIGVGSLAGIALAIFKGGVGTIFWILLSCLIIAPNSIVENALALMYREKNNNSYIGGPAYYIKKGLGYKKIAILYSIIVILAYLFGFLTIQSNTIAKSITFLYNVPSILIGIIIGILSFLIIRKGLKGIARFSSIFVPLMGIIYLLVAMLIIVKNINLMPGILSNIIHEAFNTTSLKYGILSSIIIGIERGIFASEVGTGTSAIASGSSNLDKPINQGLVGVIGCYFTTFVICLSTALIILTSNYNPNNYTLVNGIEITLNALVYHLGTFGNIVLYFCLIAFSFSTIISGYYYVESNLKFLFKNISNKVITLLKIFTCFLLCLASIISPDFIWNTCDILVAILIIINVNCLLNLKKDVIIELEVR
ncbi:MAG: amino acid carrier protein [Bacilli bacterium]|nr:amino acid carrier protein [Bacilli bacterium]